MGSFREKRLNSLEAARRRIPPRRSLRDADLWEIISVSASATLNLVLAIINLAHGIIHQELWSIGAAVFFGVLTAIDSYVSVRTQIADERFRSRTMSACGISIIALAAFMAVFLFLCISGGLNDAFSMPLMITIAVITFVVAVMAVIRLVKARHKDDAEWTLGALGVASMLGALLTLTISMIGTFGDITDQGIVVLEAVSGAMLIGALLVLGISLLRRAHSRRESK